MCTGTEANLGACTHAGWGTEDCSYTERAGVQCTVAASGLTATGGDEEVASPGTHRATMPGSRATSTATG